MGCQMRPGGSAVRSSPAQVVARESEEARDREARAREAATASRAAEALAVAVRPDRGGGQHEGAASSSGLDRRRGQHGLAAVRRLA